MSLSINNSNGDIICDTLHLLYNNDLENILDVIQTISGGNGTAITTLTATLPLTVTNVSTVNKNLTIDLSSYSTITGTTTLIANYSVTVNALLLNKISTTHESYKIGGNNVDFGSYNSTMETLTIKNTNGVTTILSVDNSGNLNTGADGVITVPILNTWEHLALKLKDSQGTVRNLTSSITGGLIWNASQLATINDLSNYTNTSALTVLLNTKQATLTASTGVFLTGATLTGYDLRWLTTGVPTLNIQCLHFKSGFTVTETFNLSTSQNQLDITSTGVTDAEMKTHISNSVYATANCGLTSVGNPSTGIVYFNVDTTILATRSQVTADIAVATHTISQVTGLQTALDNKVDDTQVLTNVPANMPFSTLVANLNKISDMVDGVSGISLGTGTGSSQRIACFETAGNGNYFYGIGLVEQTGSLPGMGIWASTGANVPHQNSSSSSGIDPHIMVSNIGNVGIGVVAPTQRLHVVGNILCSGTISGSSKSFDIEHPDPDKAEQKYRLRHWCVESDVAGGMVMYRKQITTTKASTVFIEMPNWFEHLVKNVIVFCSPDEHFGNAWGKYINNNIIEIHTSKGGKYNILITCDRADVCATTMCPQEVEFIPAEPILDGGGMP